MRPSVCARASSRLRRCVFLFLFYCRSRMASPCLPLNRLSPRLPSLTSGGRQAPKAPSGPAHPQASQPSHAACRAAPSPPPVPRFRCPLAPLPLRPSPMPSARGSRPQHPRPASSVTHDLLTQPNPAQTRTASCISVTVSYYFMHLLNVSPPPLPTLRAVFVRRDSALQTCPHRTLATHHS